MMTNKNLIFLGSLVLSLVSVGGISSITPLFFQTQIAEAQQMSGDITAPSGGNPFGGENMVLLMSIQMAI
jgi:hypothetical protein